MKIMGDVVPSEGEDRMTSASRSDAKGFSLVELLIAMLVTLIVSGAIYGLLAGGQSAFRREPELVERQQNVRLAMNLIMRDIANAGSGMPSFMQTFTRNLNACSGCPDGGAPMGLDGNRTDELEIITNDATRDNEPVCNNPGNGNSVNIRLVRGRSPIGSLTPVMIIFDDGTWTFRNVLDTSNPNTGAGSCLAGDDHVNLDLRPGGDTSGWNTSGGICKPTPTGLGNAGSPTDCVLGGTVCGTSTTACPNFPTDGPPCCTVVLIGFAEIVRYRIRDDASGVPVLQRRTSADLSGTWQTVASGIEDLQVQYTQANGTVITEAPGAPQVTPGDFGSIITQAQVTLASRSEAQNIQGMTTDASLRDAIRGRLVSAGSPRSALVALTTQPTNPLWK